MRTKSRIPLLDLGKYLKVERHAVELPDGRVIEDWAWVDMPDFASVAAMTTEGRMLFFRQTKYALNGISLAPAGGFLEPGEDPLDGARRELREETGYEAEAWHSLGDYCVDANRGAGTAHLFLATGARFVGDVESDDLEEQELVLLTVAETRDALRRHEFAALPWAALVALALDWLDDGNTR